MEQVSDRYLADWQDDQTMDVLFSPFRDNRGVNPQSWDNKISFWKDHITQYCVDNNKVVINGSTLPQAFSRKGKTPVCLHVVIDTMLKSGELVKLSEYEKSAPSGWLGWGFNLLVKKPLSWTFDAFVKKPLSVVFGSESDGAENLVFVKLVEVKAQQVLECHYSHVENELTDCVVDYGVLSSYCAPFCSDTLTFDLALLHLVRDGKCSMLNGDSGEKVLRFAKRSKRAVTPPSDCDMKLYRLKNAESLLEKQIEKLTQDMENCRLEAKMFLRKGIKTSAKSSLRKKKRLEQMRDGKETALSNIQHMLTIIQQADDTKMILDAYSSGSDAFKIVSQKYGLTTDMVDDVMDTVQQVYEDSEEISASVASGPTVSADEPSLEELEAELSALLAGGEGGAAELPPSQPHQEMVDALCQMKVQDGGDEEGAAERESAFDASLDLPDVPNFDPFTPPSGIRVPAQRPQMTSPRPQRPDEQRPLLG